jgi:23S rRNA pseudouridine1911/1915/1917 synthase
LTKPQTERRRDEETEKQVSAPPDVLSTEDEDEVLSLSPSLPLSSSPAQRFTVPSEATGTRLDTFLAAQITTTSRSQIRRAIELGHVTVNGQAVTKPAYDVSADEAIVITLPATPPLEAKPEAIPLDIIYEDEQIMVVNKPAGMVTHPGAGVSSGTLANALVYHFNQTAQQLPRRGGSSRPGIVHRLDVGTSGLLVVAKTDQAHLHLAEQFQARTVRKIYHALVYGHVPNDKGEIEAPIGRDVRSRVKMAVARAGSGRNALTLYRVVERFEEFTLLEVEIKTGRTHQIRVHLAHLKHPVVADATYDAGHANSIRNPQLRAAISKLGRPFLHATRLGLVHPSSGAWVEFAAPLPSALQSFLQIARGNNEAKSA